MAFQVANGSIPQTVERWLRDDLGVYVFRLRDSRFPGVWGIDALKPGLGDDSTVQWFDWSHGREPTLQEAIEAVMAERMGPERAAR